MNHRFKSKRKLFFIVPILILFGLSAIVMWLWNAILPNVVNVSSITYWQAMGILVLSKILFGGFGFWGRFGFLGLGLRDRVDIDLEAADGTVHVEDLQRVGMELAEGGERELRTEAQRVLIDLGRYAVNPLCAALMGVPPETQETLCVILRQSGYRQALPYLQELRMNTESSQVRHEADRAIRAIDGGVSESTPLAPLFVELADQYLTESRSLTNFPDEPHQLIWEYSPGLGLHPVAIYSEVYHEAMAMQLAESALLYDQGDQGAVSTWLLANFKRQNEQPEDYDNPMYGIERREAMYYAVVAGSAPVQRVLARSLADHNTRVARQSIDALIILIPGMSTHPIPRNGMHAKLRCAYLLPQNKRGGNSVPPPTPFETTALIAGICAAPFAGCRRCDSTRPRPAYPRGR